MPVLGQNFKFNLTGDGFLVFNTTTTQRSVNVATAGGTKTASINANSGRLVVYGSLKVKDFPLVGGFDITASPEGMKIKGAATLDLKELGTFTAATDFTVKADGIRGNFNLSKNVPSTPVKFDLKGAFTVESNAAGSKVVLKNGALELTGLGSNRFSVPLPMTVEIGFRNATGATPAHYFVAVPSTSVKPWGGPFSASFSGEVRSTGDVILDASGSFRAELSVKSWLGDFSVMKVGLNLSVAVRRSGTGNLTMTTTASGSASLLGLSGGIDATVSPSGKLTGTARFSVPFLGGFNVPFSLQL
jgi:hypothetical protein